MPATPIEFDVREIPFSLRGSWLDLSPVTALHTVKPDIHLVSHQTGMHAVFRLQPWRDGVSRRVEHAGRARVADAGSPTAGRSRRRFESKEIVRLRGSGVDLRIVDAAEVLTPFTGTYLYRDPIDGAAVFTSYETGRRYRITSLRGDLVLEGAEALGAAMRAVVATGAEWEIAIEEFETGRGASHRRQEFDAIVLAALDRVRGLSRLARARAATRRRPRDRRPRSLRALVGDGAAERVPAPRVDPDVEALDGQGLELGPLLQRARGRPARRRPGARPVPHPVRPPG